MPVCPGAGRKIFKFLKCLESEGIKEQLAGQFLLFHLMQIQQLIVANKSFSLHAAHIFSSGK